MNFLTLLQNANNEYDRGNLLGAKKYNDDVLQQFEAMNITVDSVFAIPYFNSLTLAQSIACRLHDLTSYESYEEAFKKITLALTGTYAWSYYGVHLLDACECYLNSGDCAKAQQFLNNGISILIEQNGSCNLIIFLQYYHTAKLHFHMNQYYLCIDCCQKANDAWMSDSLIPEDATSFLNQYISNENLILTMVYSNLILAGCAYGKINSPEIGIQILEEIINDPLDNYYIQTSAEITLAELYTRAENLTKARTIYQKYKNMNQLQYPDLAAALAALAIVLDTPDSLNTAFSASLYLAHLKPAVGSSITPNTPTLFASEFDGQLPPSSCYSKDALQILLYNHCLALIAKEQYSKALTFSSQLGNRGLSLNLFLLAKTDSFHLIPEIKKMADQYYEQEIRSLFLYYNEMLVYNHLSLLEYHFSLCMDAYLSCYEKLGSTVLPAKDIYDFLLNTRNISLEASYLSRTYQTLEELNHRKLFNSIEIMNTLADEDVLLEYCITRTITDTYYCVFIVTKTQITCVRLAKQSEIDSLVAKWQDLLQSSLNLNESLLQKDIRETDTLLRRHLYRPIKETLSAISARHIIISPAGSLVHFPFSQLPISARNYLGDEYEITYINSAKELITNPPLAEYNMNSALIMGNPSFVQFKPLPYAEQEVQIAASCLNASYFTKEKASLTLFEGCAQDAPSLLHMATHGIFYEISASTGSNDWNQAFLTMEKSGLILANDTLLSCNKISSFDFSNTYLIVLSACQTGKSHFHSVEGAYGLRRAFRLAGCHSMILTLWQVDDRCGCFLMNYFYKHLIEESCHPKQAFFLALNELRNYEENNQRPFAHPYYWAGYIFIE